MGGDMMEKWLALMFLSSFLPNIFSYVAAVFALLQNNKKDLLQNLHPGDPNSTSWSQVAIPPKAAKQSIEHAELFWFF